MSSQTTVTLYKWPECWGLPSLSAACIQTEVCSSGLRFQN